MVKAGFLYSACSLRDDRISALYNIKSGSWLARANGAAAQTAAIQLHALNVQLDLRCAASKHTTAPINRTRPSPCKHSPDGATRARSKHPITPYYSIYQPRKDARLSWPSWLTCSGRFTHISGLWSPISCRSSAGQEKFAGRRPMFYHCATPSTLLLHME